MASADALNGITVVGTGNIGDALFKTSATTYEWKPPGWTPPASPPPPVGIKGWEINATNTGFTAWTDPTLGRKLVSSDLTVVSGDHYASDFVTAGTPTAPTRVYRKRFTGTIFQDVNNVLYEGCQFDVPFQNVKWGVPALGTKFSYSTFDAISAGTAAGPYAVGDVNYSMNRCLVRGHSDGVRTNGGSQVQEITETYIRVRLADPGDHNDGGQIYGGSGTVRYARCNISMVPESGTLNTDAALLFGDFGTGTTFRGEVIDCLLDGGSANYTLRLYDGAKSANITFLVTGNRFSGVGVPLHRGSAFITPLTQITWSGNTNATTGAAIPLS